MKNRDKLVVGVLPVKRGFLSLEVAMEEKKKLFNAIGGIKDDFVTLVDVDDVCEGGVLFKLDEVQAAVDKFKKADIDALFICHCDFGEEQALIKVAREFDVPVLLWGNRDKFPNTFEKRGRDTQCGMFASTKVLSRNKITFSYIYNVDVETDEFMDGYLTFLRTANVVKAMKRLKIAQIGLRPQQFMSVIASEGLMVEKFGIEVVPFSVPAIIRNVEELAAAKGSQVQEGIASFKERMDCSQMTEEQLAKIAALKITVKDMMEDSGCRAGAIECWSLFSREIGVAPCMIVSELADLGLPLSCEMDLNGAITSVIADAVTLGESAVFFADLTIRHPENDNAELLWHCGPFPYSLKDPDKPARMINAQAIWELKKGDITILRCDDIDGEYKVIASEGKAVDGPETTGSYVWFESPCWKSLEEKFIFGPYIHHVAGVYGNYSRAIEEAARYLPIKWDKVGTGPRSL
ncbi:MAG TPA: fucose isomerase [Clostridia bacterium]|nr:fucose isomerase [Clostridia bacterium]